MTIQANIYLFKVNHRNTKKRCEICSKLAIKDIEDIEDRGYLDCNFIKKETLAQEFYSQFYEVFHSTCERLFLYFVRVI